MIRIRQATKLPLFFACVFGLLFLSQGLNAYRIMSNKALAQDLITESVERWKQSYLALADTSKKWEKSYRKEDTIQDLVTLYASIGLSEYGLVADQDAVIVYKIDPVLHNEMALGLTRYCLASSTTGENNGLQVQAVNYQMLFAGLKRLTSRPDIFVGTINIKGGGDVPIANLGEFCVLLRKV